MLEAIFAAVCSANRSYLQHFLSRNPPERHAEMISGFERHMSAIARFCHDNYHGAGTLTTAFIRDLHRSLYPAGYREVQRTPEGYEVVTMVPGEYKRLTVRGDRADVTFADPNLVAEEMEALVGKLNAALETAEDNQSRKDSIVFFGLDMAKIHPFPDANGRVACIAADVLLIKEGMTPIYLAYTKERARDELYRAGRTAEVDRDLTHLYELIDRHAGSRNLK